jgi:hypothetical protein
MLAVWLACGNLLEAGHVRLKNGTVLTGKPVPLTSLNPKAVPKSNKDEDEIVIYPVIMADDVGVRVFVPYRQVAEINKDVELGKTESFKLNQKKHGQSLGIDALGAVEENEPFDEFGRRIVRLRVNGKPMDVIQGVTEITPRYLKVSGINRFWEFAIPTSSVAPEVLDAMLRRATKANNPDDRLAIARFYLEAGLYFPAQNELNTLQQDFPDLAEKAETVATELRQLQAQQFLDELKLRRSAGQYQLAYEGTQKFPEQNISGAILNEKRELAAEYEAQAVKIAHARELLGSLQGELTSERRAELAAMRSEVSEKLHFATIDRLEAFLNLSASNTLKADEKLALAYSGWILGNANAITELDTVLRLWNARFLIREYLRTESPRERQDLLTQISEIEGVAVKQVSQMLPLLPPLVETPEAEGGWYPALEAPSTDEQPPVKYACLLPREYHSGRAYPLIIALRPQGKTIEDSISYWGGMPNRPSQGQRYGYIVIAPEFAESGQREYDYGVQAHRAVLEALHDARKRFHVDSDRVFLVGHGMGGDAVFDIAFSHPDLFAGAVPICGISDKFCRYYVSNVKHLPFYIIGGELDRDSVAKNSGDFMRMIQQNTDLIYAEHVGRGQEHFYFESPKVFEWMARFKRLRVPQDVEAKSLRPTDNRFWWWEFTSFPPNNSLAVWTEEKRRITPLTSNGKVTPGNTIVLQSGAKRHSLFLSPDLVDFEKRLVVRWNGGQRFNDFLKPNLGDMLEDFRLRADRQKLTWVRLDF